VSFLPANVGPCQQQKNANIALCTLKSRTCTVCTGTKYWKQHYVVASVEQTTLAIPCQVNNNYNNNNFTWQEQILQQQCIKGLVQRDLTWVKSGINRKAFI
jgi:hypothetical protein